MTTWITHNNSVATAYDWGPNGHPIRIGSTVAGTSTPPPISAASYDTLHWDGDALLFTTNSASQVDDLKIGVLGDITPLDSNFKGLTLWDRDFGGALGSAHNSTGNAGWGSTSPYRRTTCSPGGSAAVPPSTGYTGPSSLAGTTLSGTPTVGQGGLLCELGSDGYYDGFNVIQGVRTYDPQLQTWTTPDAFAGTVHDPASQKSYMYNRDNPVAFLDPSGFDSAMLSWRPLDDVFLRTLDMITGHEQHHAFVTIKDDSGRVKLIISGDFKFGFLNLNPNLDKEAVGAPTTQSIEARFLQGVPIQGRSGDRELC